MFKPEELKAWRDRMGFSQSKAAEKIGVSISLYCDMERGVNRVMPIKKRFAILCAAIEGNIKPLGTWPNE